MRGLAAVAAIVLLIVMGGCREPATAAPDDPRAPQAGAWPPLPREGFAILPWGTQVYVEPRVGGPSARLGNLVLPPAPWPVGGHVVRVVGERDGMVEVAPLQGEEIQPGRHCGVALDGEGFDVRLYVSRWSPALVLTRTHEVIDEPGRVLSLRPGAVVQRLPDDPEGGWVVSAGGLVLRALLPDDAIGRSYERPDPVVGTGWRVHDSFRPTLGGWPVAFDRTYGVVTIGAVEPDGEGYGVELLSACARATVEATREPPPPPPEPHFDFEFGLGAPDLTLSAVPMIEDLGLAPEPTTQTTIEFDGVDDLLSFPDEPGVMGVLLPPQPAWVFEEGASVYLSAAGPSVGTLERRRVFHEDAWVAGDRICFRTSFGSRFVPALPVCLDEAEGRLDDLSGSGGGFG